MSTLCIRSAAWARRAPRYITCPAAIVSGCVNDNISTFIIDKNLALKIESTLILVNLIGFFRRLMCGARFFAFIKLYVYIVVCKKSNKYLL